VVGFRQFARFERIDQTQNRARFYLFAWQPTLFDGPALVWTWGRLGSSGVSRSVTFPDRASAQPTVERLLRRRLQHRYQLVDWC
jgi:predicted DNA-binding WGR domain protein